MKLESVKKILESKIKDELAFSVLEANLYTISWNFHEIWQSASLDAIKKVLNKFVEQNIIKSYFVGKINAGGYWTDRIIINLNKSQARKLNPRKYDLNSSTGELSNGEITIKLKAGTLQFKFVELLLERRGDLFSYPDIVKHLYPNVVLVKAWIGKVQDIAREINGKLEEKGEIDFPIQSGKGYRFK